VSGSAAEERIRTKAEAMLRQLFPDARIIHELVLQQGGVRIDLAAIRPGYIAAIEIKSERDVLTRLPDQAKAAMRVTDLFGVCVASKYRDKIGTYFTSAAVTLPYGAELLVETEDGFDTRLSAFAPQLGQRLRVEPRLCNPADRLEMLWASELRAISGTKFPRQSAKRLICETMTGRKIREAVCAALRARPFPRADAPVPYTFQDLAA
jgi:hypothetical protein